MSALCQIMEEFMRRIAKFYKVSREQFFEGWMDTFPGTERADMEKIYENISLPKRATAGSAGYDFFSPVDFQLGPGETIKIPTGTQSGSICARIPVGIWIFSWVPEKQSKYLPVSGHRWSLTGC